MRYDLFKAGPWVTGDSFIGREDIYKQLRRDIFSSNMHSTSVVLTGLPRTGKTSLACQCIRDKEALNKKGIYPCFFNMGKQKTFGGFIFSMVKVMEKSYRSAPFFDDELKDAFAFFSNKPNDSDLEEINFGLEELFFILGQEKKIKTVIVLDEFDNVENIFHRDIAYFHALRDLITNPDNRLTLIMTSRRDIAAIEKAGGLQVGSTFANSVHRKKLQGFSKQDLALFFAAMEKCGVCLNADQKRRMLFYAGRSPFLLSALAHEILAVDESFPVADIDIDEVFLAIKDDTESYFRSLLDYMEREDVYKDMVQIFIGPRYDITQRDINELIDRGYLYQEEREEGFNDSRTGEKFSYQTVSEYFVEYIRYYQEQKEEEGGLITWAELNRTEKFLRDVIQIKMEKEFGREQWENQLKRRDYFNVEQAERFMRMHRKLFPRSRNFNVLKVINFKDLSNIICDFWDKHFKDIFNPPYTTENNISSDIGKLHRVRNPLAHVFSECLTDNDRAEVDAVCKKMEKVDARFKGE